MPISPARKMIDPYWSVLGASLHCGDVMTCLERTPAQSVHCVITSPPYWGLRDYDTGTWRAGSAECDHKRRGANEPKDPTSTLTGGRAPNQSSGLEPWPKNICGKCGASRTDTQIGSEPSPDCGTNGRAQCGACFVCSVVGVFRRLRRVMRDDATVWLNLGDSYTSGGRKDFGPQTGKQQTHKGSLGMPRNDANLPDGNIIGVPWRVALALQADEWLLIQDIIWSKPNAMPEPVMNRCVKSHEHIFLLAKGKGYYFDATAIQEEAKAIPRTRKNGQCVDETKANHDPQKAGCDGARNKRDVWTVPTYSYSGAHHAVYSPQLIMPCILAGTSEYGCCARCGKPWERVVVVTKYDTDQLAPTTVRKGRDRSFGWSRNGKPSSTLDSGSHKRDTVGWRKACRCQTNEVIPCTVLDPFVGSGTTVATAIQLGRHGIGIDLSDKYLRENAIPRIEAALSGDKLRKGATAFRPLPSTPLPPERV